MTTNQNSPEQTTPHALWSALPVALAVIALAVMIGGIQLGLWLRYDREAILAGELWRILTAHIVHLGWKHLLMNVAGLALIWLLFGRLFNTAWWSVIVVACALGVSGGLLLFHPGIGWYVGMSGVLHGMFLAGALASLARGYRAEALLLGLVVVKLIWEQLYGPLASSRELAGGTVVVDAHLYGALTGTVVAAIVLAAPLWRRG